MAKYPAYGRYDVVIPPERLPTVDRVTPARRQQSSRQERPDMSYRDLCAMAMGIAWVRLPSENAQRIQSMMLDMSISVEHGYRTDDEAKAFVWGLICEMRETHG